MLLENRAPGDASTSDGPSSRTSCALRGLRWPGMPALLIRMVWLMEERLRKCWVWNRYRGRGNGWVGGRTKRASFSISPSGLSVRVWEIVRQKDVAARVRWVSWNWKGGSSISQRLFDNHYLIFDRIPLMSERGLSREHIDGYRMHMLFTSGSQLVICNQKIFCRSVLTVLQC